MPILDMIAFSADETLWCYKPMTEDAQHKIVAL